MGVDSSGKGVAGMPDALEMSPGQDQRSKSFKDKGRKAAPSVVPPGLQRTTSLGEGDRDLHQKDVVAHVRNSGNATGSVPGKTYNSSLEKVEDPSNKKKPSLAGSARAAFTSNATHSARAGPDSGSLDCDINCDASSVATTTTCTPVELRTRGGHVRGMLGASHSNKPTPSKWDDAEPWLPVLAASEATSTPTRTKSKSGPLQPHLVASQYPPVLLQKRGAFANALGRQHAVVNGVAATSASTTTTTTTGSSSNNNKLAPLSSGSHSVTSGSSDAQSSGDDLTTTGEDSGQSSDQPPRPSFERTKKVDIKYSTASQGDSGPKFSFMPPAAPAPSPRENTVDRYPLNDVEARGIHVSKLQEPADSNDESFSKPTTLRTEKPTSDACLEVQEQAHSSTYDSAAVTVRSVCMRDMGTEMTPIASQEPSRTGTPLAATTPTLGSPSSSRPATPHRFASKSSGSNSALSGQSVADGESKASDFSEKELQVRTRQEILALGAQLGKANVAAWAPKLAEEANADDHPSVYDVDELRKSRLQSRAAAWEEAERSKNLARYTREESRIQAWENHQKAKAEAELRRVEVEIERVRSRANEKLMCKLAATRRQAEDMRAAAEARRAEQAAQIAQRAERIRRTGKVPGSIFPGLCCT